MSPSRTAITALTILVTGVLVAGCVSLPPAQDLPDACTDTDGDGYGTCSFRPDCDDGNAAVHPGALEQCGDTDVQDCGAADLACADELVGNTVTTEGAVWTVGNGEVALGFDRALTIDGEFGPVSLRSIAGSGAQLLLVGEQTNQRLTGSAYWEVSFSWRPSATPSFEVLAEGPAMNEVLLGWRDGVLSGETRYAIHPDGRIHRHDDLTLDSNEGGNYMTAYVVLDQTRFATVDWDENAGGPSATGVTDDYFDYYDGLGTADWVCAHDPPTGDRVGFVPRGPGGVPGLRLDEFFRPAAGDRVRGVAMEFDWIRGGNVPPGDYETDLLIHVGTGTGAAPCTELDGLAAAFLDPPLLVVDDPGNLVTGGDVDPDGDGYGERIGAYQASAADASSIVMTPAASLPSMTVRIDGVVSVNDPVVTSGDRTLRRGDEYHYQRQGETAWLFLRGPVVAGEPLALTWP